VAVALVGHLNHPGVIEAAEAKHLLRLPFTHFPLTALPNGEVWVLFGARPSLGAAVPWDFYRFASLP
jgi:hypothetical protein